MEDKNSAPNDSQHSYVFIVLIIVGIAIMRFFKAAKFGSVYLRGGLTIPEARRSVNGFDNV